MSGVSEVSGGGGLKLTISKAVLQQAGRSLPGGGSVPRGAPSPWASGKPGTIYNLPFCVLIVYMYKSFEINTVNFPLLFLHLYMYMYEKMDSTFSHSCTKI